MQSRERLVIYTLLLVSLGFSAFGFLNSTAAPAFAQDSSGQKSITLTGDGKDVVLFNKGSRLAWADNEFSKAYSIGFVHIGKALRQLIESEAFKEEFENLRKELDEAGEKFNQRAEELNERGKSIKPDSPEGQALGEEWQQLRTEYMTWQQSASEQSAKMQAQHLEQAYRQLVEAVEVVAERKNIDIVYRFIATGDPFEATDPEQAMNEIRLRSVVKYPSALDITSDVLDELALKDE